VLFPLAEGLSAQQTVSPETVVAIKAGQVIDVENGRVLEKQIILLRGKRIEAIGGELRIPASLSM
jgi:hypothetical protein